MKDRDSIGMSFGLSAEVITFQLSEHFSSFVIKAHVDQQIKIAAHTYWQDEDVYVSSEYREGEHIRLTVYQNNQALKADKQFYVATGLKFEAKQDSTYRINILSAGSIVKLLTIEMEQTPHNFDDALTAQEYSAINHRMEAVWQQTKSVLAISQLSDILHEKNARSSNHATCIYMSYILGETCLVLLLVGLQVRYMGRLLNADTIV